MNSKSSLAKALQGTHTLFLVTLPDFVTGGVGGTELEHGKNVADEAKEAGVQHVVFSSLINVTEASGGRLPHVAHFDRKADIEKYIRSLGTPSTFIQPGYYMTNFINLQLLRKGDDGSYTLAGPTGATKAQLPLFYPDADMGKYRVPPWSGQPTRLPPPRPPPSPDAATSRELTHRPYAGKYVISVIKSRSKVLGKQVYAAADYYTLTRIMQEFQEVTGKKGQYVQLDQDTYKGFLPPPIAQEILENELLCEDPGFFAGGSLVDGHKLLAEVGLAPTTWKDFLESKKELFA